jgi:periplasmic protein TonB
MFGELLESRATPVRNRGGTVASVVGHAVLIGLAVLATRTTLSARGPGETIIPLPTLTPVKAPSPSAPAPPQPTRAPSGPSLPKPLTLVVPTVVPDHIPDIDPSTPVIDPTAGIEWGSRAPGTDPGNERRGSGESIDGIPFAPGVDKPAMAMPGNPSPRYPDILRRASIKGEVIVQVVIDTTGRADMATVRVVSSDHPLLTESVLAVLPRARFVPAETGGRKVRMWAVQSFVFEVK